MNELKAKPKKVSVVIGSGGIRTLGALPLLEFLKNKKVAIDLVVGSGGGALLAAMFTSGIPLDEIPDYMSKMYNRKLFEKFDYMQIVKILGIRRTPFESPPATYSNRKYLEHLKEIFGERRIEELPLKLNIQATDMQSGKVVNLTKGSLVDSIYASNVTYPFFSPIKIEGNWLAGGIYTAAFPIMTAVVEQSDVIFGIGFYDEKPIAAEGLAEYMSSFFFRSCTNSQGRQAALAISLHEGEIVLMNVGFETSIGLWDIKKIPEIIAAGKRTLAKRQEEIEEIISGIHLSI